MQPQQQQQAWNHNGSDDSDNDSEVSQSFAVDPAVWKTRHPSTEELYKILYGIMHSPPVHGAGGAPPVEPPLAQKFNEVIDETIKMLNDALRVREMMQNKSIVQQLAEISDEVSKPTADAMRSILEQGESVIDDAFRKIAGTIALHEHLLCSTRGDGPRCCFLTTGSYDEPNTVCPYDFFYLVNDVYNTLVPSQANTVLERPYPHDPSPCLLEDCIVASLDRAEPVFSSCDRPYESRGEDEEGEAAGQAGAAPPQPSLVLRVPLSGDLPCVDPCARKRPRDAAGARNWEAARTMVTDNGRPYSYEIKKIPSDQSKRAWAVATSAVRDVVMNLLSHRKGSIWDFAQSANQQTAENRHLTYMAIAMALYRDPSCSPAFLSLCNEHRTYKQHCAHTSNVAKHVLKDDVTRLMALTSHILSVDPRPSVQNLRKPECMRPRPI